MAHRFFARRRPTLRRFARGAAATEYVMILAAIVIPIGALLPLFLNMLHIYGARVVSLMGLPFP